MIINGRTRYQVPGSRYPVPGTRYLVPGAGYQVPGRYQVPGTRCLAPGTRHLVPQVPGTQVPGTRYLLPGTKYLVPVDSVPGTWCLVPGTWFNGDSGLGVGGNSMETYRIKWKQRRPKMETKTPKWIHLAQHGNSDAYKWKHHQINMDLLPAPQALAPFRTGFQTASLFLSDWFRTTRSGLVRMVPDCPDWKEPVPD